MLTLVEALNFRCLRFVRQGMGRFHVLVGPNASGKTTFLDVVGFLGKLVHSGPEAAVRERRDNFQDLLWGRTGERFELAVEAAIPNKVGGTLHHQEIGRARGAGLVSRRSGSRPRSTGVTEHAF